MQFSSLLLGRRWVNRTPSSTVTDSLAELEARSPTMRWLVPALAVLLTAAPQTHAADLNTVDRHALDVLRDAQPAAVRQSCAKLATWKLAVPACDWAGVTCDDSVPRRVSVIDLRYCGLTVLPAEALKWTALEVLELRGNKIKVRFRSVFFAQFSLNFPSYCVAIRSCRARWGI